MALPGIRAPAQLNLQDNMATSWKTWYGAYQLYAIASGAVNKPEKTQCALFLHVAGIEAQKVYRSLKIPSANQDKFAPLIAAFNEYCAGKTNITVVRYQFNSYNQSVENIDTYIRELKSRIAFCNYGDIEDSLLSDRIVCGVKSDKLRDVLLQTPNLTLESCIEKCRLSEHTAAQLNGHKTEEIEAQVDEIKRRDARASPWTPRRQQQHGVNRQFIKCDNCGYSHPKGQCPARGKECIGCKKIGHFIRVCRSSASNTKPINEIRMYQHYERFREEDQQSINNRTEYDDEDLFIGMIGTDKETKDDLWYADINIEGQDVHFKLDTGSEANIIPTQIMNTLQNITVKPARCRLITYTGERVKPEGEATITINGRQLKFQVTRNGSPILGKDACVQLHLIARVNEIKEVTTPDKAARDMVNKYTDIFNGLGTIKVNAKIHIDTTVEPVIDPPRRIPHAIKDDVRKELDRMLKMGVIVEQQEPTPWVSSITIVRKPGKIRICLDPTKLNKAILRGPYPTRTVEEVVTKTNGAKFFSVLDANSGYWQIVLDKESSKLCTFNTPWGRYSYTRLPFGIKTAGDIFIHEMNKILSGLPGVDVIADDILIHGHTITEHNERLKSVLDRAREVNLKLNPNKSKICKTEVNYVGHILTQQGLKPNKERVDAIINMPTPKDKAAVQRFMGMMGYVSKFIPNMAEIAKPLRILLHKETAWHWDDSQVAAFEKLKTLLTNAPVLKYYDVTQKTTLQVDASKSGLGATLFQNNQPIAMASKALDETQAGYAVIEKELLAICFGCKKFHEYIFGKEVTVQTDHKPLVSIMTKPLHKLTARMQRMRMRLQNYDLKVIHLQGSHMYFADTLSRAHINKTEPNNLFDSEISIASINMVEDNITRIAEITQKDETLKEIIKLTLAGWPNRINQVRQDIKPYFTHRNEITVNKFIIYKENRIIIPKELQHEMLEKIHETHLGMVKSKQLAREYIFWPGIDKQIEDKITKCQICQQFRKLQHAEPLISHEIPDIPFYKVGIDFLQVKEQVFLLIIDYYSKFPEIIEMNNTSSEATITELKKVFCRYGIPNTVVSDNGPQFSSREFKEFAAEYGFKCSFSNPMYPQSNGQAERYVQTIKRMIKKAKIENKEVQLALLNYRNTPLSGIHASPAELLMSRKLRSKFPIEPQQLKSKTQNSKARQIKKLQLRQKRYFDKHASTSHKPLQVGDKVKYLNHKQEWTSGNIKTAHNPRSRDYDITNKRGNTIKRNRRHIYKIQKDNVPKQNNSTNNYITRYGRIINPVKRLGIDSIR